MKRVSEYIDLKRRFRDLRDDELGDDELEDTETLASLGECGFGASIGWSELLEHPRVVLLAGAGAGKTREMSEQARRLVEDGRHAFFVPLEWLDREPLSALLTPQDEKRLELWIADGSESGWFFLDAARSVREALGPD